MGHAPHLWILSADNGGVKIKIVIPRELDTAFKIRLRVQLDALGQSVLSFSAHLGRAGCSDWDIPGHLPQFIYSSCEERERQHQLRNDSPDRNVNIKTSVKMKIKLLCTLRIHWQN